MLLVGAFGASLVAIGLMEKVGIKINEGSMKFILEVVKLGAILYVIKLAATLFL